MTKRSGTKVFMVIVVLIGLILSACGGAQVAPVKGQFVGHVENSDAFVGVVAYADGHLGAYVCDGATISEWFQGPIEGSAVDITNKVGAHLIVNLTAKSVLGTVTLLDGSTLAFTANLVEKPLGSDPLGFYRAEETIDGVAYVGGWIILPNGEQRGAIMSGGKLKPAPAISSSSKTVSVEGLGTFTPGWKDPEPQP